MYVINRKCEPEMILFKVSMAASQIRDYCLENQGNDPLVNNHRDGNPFADGKRRCVIL